MDKVKVICHMYVTIDGKIQTELQGYPDSLEAGIIYDNFTFDSAKAWGCGRDTFEYLSDKNIKLDSYLPKEGELIDHVVRDDIYCFAFDRRGKLFFKSEYNEYAERKSRFVSVLTESVDRRFISYLDSKNISYIFCGKDDFDLNLFLEKLSSLGISTFMLCGGPKINSVFMKEDLIDEISLIICPGVQGGRKELTFVGNEDINGFPKYYHIDKVKILEGDTVQLIYTKERR